MEEGKKKIVLLAAWIDKDFSLPVRALKDIVKNIPCKYKEYYDGVFTQSGINAVRITRR